MITQHFLYQLADELDKISDNKSLFNMLGDLFSDHVSNMEKSGFMEYAMSAMPSLILLQDRRNCVLRVLVANTNIVVNRLQISSADCSNTSERPKFERELSGALASSFALLQRFWKIEAKGTISPTCRYIVSLHSQLFKIVAEYSLKCPDGSFVIFLAQEMTKFVGVVCLGEPLPVTDRVDRQLSELHFVPISTKWLSHDLSLVAQRTYNCLVSTNVSLFSGWHGSEFAVRLLDNEGYNFFGISSVNGLVTGCLQSRMEDEVASQWEMLEGTLAQDLTCGFRRKLTALREAPEYQAMKERYRAESCRQVILHAEDKCLELMLDFSRVCILAAKESGMSSKFLYMSLAILMPISQFCLNQSLWDCSIGRSSSRSVSLKPWVSALEKQPKAKNKAPAEEKDVSSKTSPQPPPPAPPPPPPRRKVSSVSFISIALASNLTSYSAKKSPPIFVRITLRAKRCRVSSAVYLGR